MTSDTEPDGYGYPLSATGMAAYRVCRVFIGSPALSVGPARPESSRSNLGVSTFIGVPHRYRSPARHPAEHNRPEGAFEPVWVSSVALWVDDFPATPGCGPIRHVNAGNVCLGCGRSNPGDARFCNGCAAPLDVPAGAGDVALPGPVDSGRYVPIKALGEGARKHVYLAIDERLAREVALAIVKTEGLDSAGRARLVRERGQWRALVTTPTS